MRKIEQLMNNSIRNGQDFCYSNTMVTHEGRDALVYLHGNHIATVGDTFVTIFDGGWQSNTTKSRLNAICNEFRPQAGVFQKNFDWFIRHGNAIFPFYSGSLI